MTEKKKKTGLSLGEAIKYFRELKGFTQTDLVERMSPPISTTTLQNIENGSTKDPAFSKIIDILDILGFDLEDLRYCMSTDVETEALDLLSSCQIYARRNEDGLLLLYLDKLSDEMIKRLPASQKQRYYLYKAYKLFTEGSVKEAKETVLLAQNLTAKKDSPILTYNEARIYNYIGMFGFDNAREILKQALSELLEDDYFDNTSDHSAAVLIIANAICYLTYNEIAKNYKALEEYDLNLCDELYDYSDFCYKRAGVFMNFKYWPSIITFRCIAAFLKQNNDYAELEDIKRARRLARDLELYPEINEINQLLSNLDIRA